jgi:hypothetical protein
LSLDLGAFRLNNARAPGEISSGDPRMGGEHEAESARDQMEGGSAELHRPIVVEDCE